jgi:hypothetical protein
VEGYAGDDQRDTEDLQRRRHLGQDGGADASCRGGQQRGCERAGGVGEPGHGEPVTDVGNHRGGDTCGQRDRIDERGSGLHQADRQGDDPRAGRHLLRWAFCKGRPVIADRLRRPQAADLAR